MKRKLTVGILLFILILAGVTPPTTSQISDQFGPIPLQSISPAACTSFCLDNGDHCVFGANQDNTLEIGLLFINKRNVLKTTWDPSTSGEYARWISRYGSVTVNFTGYQMAWAGMNEAGLMISTMSVEGGQGPTPDERPPIERPFWVQYQLDNHRTVEQVIASDTQIRIAAPATDHYLICDRTGSCATIEFFDGKMVYHTAGSLPVNALTNNPYDESVSAWKESLFGKGQTEDNSLWRFTTVANRGKAFSPSNADEAVAYALDTLAAASRPDTVWSFVFDPENLRVHYRTNHNPRIRFLDLSKLDFSCGTPVRLLDVHAEVSGDISSEFVTYTHAASFAHSTRFFSQYEGVNLSPFILDTLLWGLESFPCQDAKVTHQAGMMRYHPLFPQTVSWGSLFILHRAGPFWIALVVISLMYIVWRTWMGEPASFGRRLFWAILAVLLGPFCVLAYLFTLREKAM